MFTFSDLKGVFWEGRGDRKKANRLDNGHINVCARILFLNDENFTLKHRNCKKKKTSNEK